MTQEEIFTFFASWRDAYTRRDSTAFAAHYADNCVLESPAYGRLAGRALVENAHRGWFVTFPDVEVEFGDLLVTGDRVVQTSTMHGTDTGGFLGQAPTGKRFRQFVVCLHDLGDGRIVHERRVYDVHGLLLELTTGGGDTAEAAQMYRDALMRARLEQEVKIAAEIQRALLPEGQHEGYGFDLAASSRPCRAIGGDFLDYFDLSNGAFGFVLGDVAGKGPPAALLAARLQGMVAASASSVVAPAEIVTRLNLELVRRSVDSRFATLFYGVLTPDGRLTYCNAGHNPPVVVGGRGVRRLEKGGLIIGAFKEITFHEETVELDPGDVLVVFSDGVTEALSVDGIEFGEDRLLSCVNANRGATATVLLDCLIDAVREFTVGAEQSDDLTALVLRYSG
jgi:serine phosphatase RsbU (regulator of sigma subunit)/predicted ester cyclase